MADPTFYRTPQDAAAAPAEQLAYVAAFHRGEGSRPDALAVVDVRTPTPTAAWPWTGTSW